MIISFEQAGFLKTIDPLRKSTNYTSRKVFALDIFTHSISQKLLKQNNNLALSSPVKKFCRFSRKISQNHLRPGSLNA